MISSSLLSAGYSTATGQAIAGLVASHYELGDSATCHLLNRGFNDTFLVRTAAGQRFVARVSGGRGRTVEDIRAETGFLAHLEAVGVAVAAAVPTRDRQLFCIAKLPDGDRAFVLFPYIDGKVPDVDAPADARAQGHALARVHGAADGFSGRTNGNRRLDLDQLLHRPVARILALGLNAPKAYGDLSLLATRLSVSVERMDQGLTRTRCHGDCHGLNARISTSGSTAGQAIFFDFDDGGYGYLAYDLAVHLWAQVSFGRKRHAMWHAFDEGYRSVRSVTPEDEAALPIFVAIRHIWLMGEFAGKAEEWGSEHLPSTWLENQMAFLLAWESERLSPTLFADGKN